MGFEASFTLLLKIINAKPFNFPVCQKNKCDIENVDFEMLKQLLNKFNLI